MRRVACLLYDRFQLLDLAGPLAAFEVAGLYAADAYAIEYIAERDGPVRSSSGAIVSARGLASYGHCDVLVIPGGYGIEEAAASNGLLAYLRDLAGTGRCIVSVCTGAFVLAAAGLLSNRRATTHWHEAAALAQRYPDIKVDTESLYVRDGNIWTSGGVAAGLDLALAMIVEDHGTAVGRQVAQALLLPFARPGSQPQKSRQLEMVAPTGRFADVLAWARMNLAEPLSIERLADRAGLSARQFTREFSKTVGVSPAKAIEQLRLEKARSAIESGATSFDLVARQSGFGNSDRMRRAFVRTFGEPPRALRRRP